MSTAAAVDRIHQAQTTISRRNQDDDGDVRTPVPGLADLASLIDRHRASDVDVSLTVTGEARPLPALSDLAAYRIIQEALTNARKHAPGLQYRSR